MRILFSLAVLCNVVLFAEESFPPFTDFLRDIEITEEKSGLEGVDCIYAINLAERPERWNALKGRFTEQGAFVNRVDAVNGWNIPTQQRNELIDPRAFTSRILLLNGGEIGCLLSHISIYRDAILRDFDVIWACEDDIKFQGKIDRITSLLEELTLIDPDWDLLYTDSFMSGSGSQKYRPEQKPYTQMNQPISENLLQIHGRFGTHSMIFSKKGVYKAFAYFLFHSFWAPIDIDIHYADLREYAVRRSITGIASYPSDTQPGSSLGIGR